MLPLHLDQQCSGTPQQRNADRLIVDERPRPAIPGQDAANHDIALRLQPLLDEQPHERMPRRWREACRDAGVFGTRPHQTRVGPRTEGEAQAVQQNRLASAGLAGQHGQAGPERQVQPIDQHNVTDCEGGKHAAALAAARGQKIECQARAKNPRSSVGRGGPGCCTRPLSNRLL